MRHRLQLGTPPLTDEEQAITEGKALDNAALRSLRDMFLLLDEWDRAAQNGCQDAPEGAEVSIALKST